MGSGSYARRGRRPWSFLDGHERACALLGAVTIAFSSILVRLSHTSPSTAAIFRCVYALPVLGALALAEDRRFGARTWRERRFGLGAGTFFAVDIMLWNHSIADVGAGLATVLANVQVVVLPLVAWAVLRERLARRILTVLPLTAAGVLLISGVLEHGAYGRDPAAGALYGLAAGIAYVGFLLLLRHGGSDLRHRAEPRAGHPASPDARRPVHPVAGPLFDATAVSAVLCVAAGLVIGDARLVPTWPSAGWLATLALSSQVVGWLLIGSSLPRLPAALASMLLTVQPIGSMILAAVIFGESPTGLQLAGAALVVVALVSVAGARRAARGDAAEDAEGAEVAGPRAHPRVGAAAAPAGHESPALIEP